VSVADINLGVSVSSSIYRTASAPSSHIFIVTNKWFSKFMWETGDRVIFRGVNATLASGTSAATTASVNAVEEWINRDEGHLIVGIGNTSSPWTVADNANSVGYGNVLIIQSRFTDPTVSGAITPYSFGTDSNINAAFDAATAWTGAGINASHQVQLVFKVISREYDPATKVRPDNTY
jgi:hypothetical protein